MINLYQLQQAGYPFAADDLTLEEWTDLGRIRSALEQQQRCPLMGRN
jgi:hypothetical protein